MTSAEVGPIAESRFAVTATRAHAQVEDSRYQVKGEKWPVTYNYQSKGLSVDKESQQAYKDALRGRK